MTMDIEQMMADGVNQYLIDLASMKQIPLFIKIGTKLENPTLYH